MIDKEFWGLPQEDLSWIESIGTEATIPADTPIICEGKPPTSFYLVLEGLFSLQFPLLPKDCFHTVGDGVILGEMWFLEHISPQVTVISLEESRVLIVPYDRVIDRLNADPEFAARFYRTLSTELSAKLRKTSNFVLTPESTNIPLTPKWESLLKTTPQGPVELLTETGEPNYELISSILSKLKPIEEIFTDYYTKERSSSCKLALNERERALEVATISAEGMCLLLDITRELGIDDLPERVSYHEGTLKASEKNRLLPEVAIQKSITVKVYNTIGMVTGIGDWKLNRSLLSSLTDYLEISRSSARNFSINPVSIVPEVEFALLRGMVSNFIPPRIWTRTSFLGILVPESTSGDFAVSLSPLESLILPQEHFQTIVETYAKRAYPYLHIISIPKFS